MEVLPAFTLKYGAPEAVAAAHSRRMHADSVVSRAAAADINGNNLERQPVARPPRGPPTKFESDPTPLNLYPIPPVYFPNQRTRHSSIHR